MAPYEKVVRGPFFRLPSLPEHHGLVRLALRNLTRTVVAIPI